MLYAVLAEWGMTTNPEHPAGRYRGRTPAEWAAISEIQVMDCFYMINKVFERLGTKAGPARAVLRAAKFADDLLAAMLPGLRLSFGNAVLIMMT